MKEISLLREWYFMDKDFIEICYDIDFGFKNNM